MQQEVPDSSPPTVATRSAEAHQDQHEASRAFLEPLDSTRSEPHLTHIPIPQQLGSGCTLRRSTRRSDHQVTRTAHPHWTETRLDETMSEGNPDALPGLVAKPPTGPWERRCRSQSRSHPSTISAPSKRHQARMPGNVCGFARVNLGSFRRPRRSELNYALPNAVNDADHGRPAQCPRTTTPSQTQGNSPPSESGPDRDP